MADLKKTLLSIQQIFLLIVAVAVVFFAFLNMDPVTIDLFFTTVTTTVALLLLVPLAPGCSSAGSGDVCEPGRRQRGQGRRRSSRTAGRRRGPDRDVDWQNLDLDKIEV